MNTENKPAELAAQLELARAEVARMRTVSTDLQRRLELAPDALLRMGLCMLMVDGSNPEMWLHALVSDLRKNFAPTAGPTMADQAQETRPSTVADQPALPLAADHCDGAGESWSLDAATQLLDAINAKRLTLPHKTCTRAEWLVRDAMRYARNDTTTERAARMLREAREMVG